ncbi:hypothetical protein HJC23_004103 [Cyclotella cryptica]|uniref:N-alpha-acetyltransferase 40 n=1 Tax=Cyclotella cryptica TaxID=29204 RepID=A0ABD3NMM5_9STRA
MKLQHIKQAISDAKNQNHFTSLPPSFLKVDIPISASNTKSGQDDNNSITARIEHFSTPLPPTLLYQCLRIFEENMGDLYRQSSWGLDMKEKRKEFVHDDARFLVILTEENAFNRTKSDVNGSEISQSTNAKSEPTVLGFVHYRFEPDDEDDPIAPVSYVYELQIQAMQQKSGLGKRLMSIVELLALKCRMEKVMLTVFKMNTKALGFYLHKMNYEVDECSPSNFQGEENENCDYEILSKSLVVRSK